MSVKHLVCVAGLMLCLGLQACTDAESPFVIEYVGVSGVVRSGQASFSLVLDPCEDTMVSRVELWVHSVDAQGVDYPVLTIMTATFDPPMSPRRLLISTAFDYVPEAGVVRVVNDEEALRRFNEDESYLRPFDPDRYLGWSAWDAQGQPIPLGGSMTRRFEAGIGEVALSDFVGPLGEVVCPDGSRAWAENQ